MNKIYLWCTLVCAGLAFTGCSDEELVESTSSWQEGESIIIGARAGYENGETQESRTEYNGSVYTDPTTGRKTERVNWVAGDKIGIYSNKAINPMGDKPHYAEYKFKESLLQTETKHYGVFEPTASASLQWGGQVEHTFYAIYPATSDNRASSVNSNGDVSGIIPVDQSPVAITYTPQKGYVMKPQMKVAYMLAKTVVNPNNLSEKNTINFSFQSIVTALDIELKLGNNVNSEKFENITGVTIHSGQNIAGGFVSHLEQPLTTEGYYPCEWENTVTAVNNVRLSFTHDKDHPNGVKLNSNESLKFTVFLLPIVDLNDLTLTVEFQTGATTRRLAKKLTDGSYSDVTFTAHRRHFIRNLALPATFEGNNWISRLDDKVLLSELSIPGTGNSYSKGAPDGVKSQTLSVGEQWNLGIRCFDVMVGNPEKAFENTIIRTSKENEVTGVTVKDVFDDLLSPTNLPLPTDSPAGTPQRKGRLIDNPNEFAVLLLLYQPADGMRKAHNFIISAKKYLENGPYAANLLMYRPGLTIGDVRGKLMVILRPTSDEEDTNNVPENSKYNIDINAPEHAISNTLVIDGWGSLQDKWKQRGYNVLYNAILNLTNPQFKAGTMESDIFNSTEFGHITPDKPQAYRFKRDVTKVDYGYDTNIERLQAYVQEWPRVVKERVNTKQETLFDIGTWYHWEESYSEKLADASNTLANTMNRVNSNSTVYINSLCGYFIDQNAKCDRYGKVLGTPKWGTTTGDFLSFANRINTEFYGIMEEYQKTHTAGPMGIIMMNFVGNTEFPASYLMPITVVRNNFTFPLNKKQ